MTDEKKPPQGAAGAKVQPASVGGLLSQARLIDALYELDSAYGRATRRARAAGEMVLMAAIDERWKSYEVLLAQCKPAKLFE